MRRYLVFWTKMRLWLLLKLHIEKAKGLSGCLSAQLTRIRQLLFGNSPWGPLAGSIEQHQNAYLFSFYLIHQDIMRMNDKFVGSRNSSWFTGERMGENSPIRCGKKFIHAQGRINIIFSDILNDFVTSSACWTHPEKFHTEPSEACDRASKR